ncbi:unnamed protein product [Dicrocoelium dendriticum]|nr:unnamed protein product [Dicrocoelium dendriticum]
MSTDNSPLVSVTPEKVLYIKAFDSLEIIYGISLSRSISADKNTECSTDAACQTVTLRNLRDAKVFYRVESNVPELYYFFPRYGCLDALRTTELCVVVLPFDFDQPTNHYHELTIQSMLATSEETTELQVVWEDADPAKIWKHKLQCIPWVQGNLVMNPSHELVLDEDRVKYSTQTSSTTVSTLPKSSSISPGKTKILFVFRKPLEMRDVPTALDTITISASSIATSSNHPICDLLYTIKCVYVRSKTPPSLSKFEGP